MLRLRWITLSLWKNNLIRNFFGWKVPHPTQHLSRKSLMFINLFTSLKVRSFSSSLKRSTELSQQDIKKLTSSVEVGGEKFEIRPMLPSDAQNEKKFVNSLSFETVYNRYA